MENSIKKYLQGANRAAHEQFIGVDGFIDEDMQFTGAEGFFGADAAAAAPAAAAGVMRSQPYIITVSNASERCRICGHLRCLHLPEQCWFLCRFFDREQRDHHFKLVKRYLLQLAESI